MNVKFAAAMLAAVAALAIGEAITGLPAYR